MWPDSFVEDTGLTRNISLLRRALGDDGQRFIVTVARIGYRFAASVAHLAGPSDTTSGFRVPTRNHLSERDQVFVGRGRELALLRGAVERAKQGRGGVLALAGEPGIGKTTVVERVLDEVKDVCAIGRGRCSERLAGTEPHLPLLEALDELTRTDPAVGEILWRTAPTWAQHVFPASRHRADVAEPAGSGSPERLMRELTMFLEEASTVRPTVIVIEDLHWADASTIDAVAHLGPRVTHTSLLVLATYRPRDLFITQNPFARQRGELIAGGYLDEVEVDLGQRHLPHDSFAGANRRGQFGFTCLDLTGMGERPAMYALVPGERLHGPRFARDRRTSGC